MDKAQKVTYYLVRKNGISEVSREVFDFAYPSITNYEYEDNGSVKKTRYCLLGNNTNKMTKYYQILGERIIEISPGEFFSGSSYPQVKREQETDLEIIVKKPKETDKHEKKIRNSAY